MAFKFIDTIEVLAKSDYLREGDVDSFLKELLTQSSKTMGCSRVNVWIFDEDQTMLNCLLSYCSSRHAFESGYKLKKADYPNYFSHLTRNEIIVSDRAMEDPISRELVDSYLSPNNIKSMIDVPLRSEGVMIGVVCFDHIGTVREWNDKEQKFAQSVSQLLSLALETKKKREYREALESLVMQKDLLLAEINHRVKNNISIILSLINLQKSKVKDQFHERLIDEIKNKVFSMAAVQEQLHLSKYLDRIDVEEYLHRLVNNLDSSFGGDKKVTIKWDLQAVLVDITKAIPFGLIANEIITNSYKYAFPAKNSTPSLFISCAKINDQIVLKIKDNGPGISKSTEQGMGMDIVESLCAQIDGKVDYSYDTGFEAVVSFPN